MDLEHEKRLTAVEELSKSNTLRLNKLEESTEAINRLATSMEVMAERQERVAEKQEAVAKTVEKLDGKVTALEQKPAKRWDGLWDKALGALVGGLVTFLLLKLGLG